MYGLENFYILEPDEGLYFGRKWTYGETIPPTNRGECEKCPVCNKPVSMLKWLSPYRINLSSMDPRKWGDFIWGAGFPLLVSSRFREIYVSEGLKGITEFNGPVEIIDKNIRSPEMPVSTNPVYFLIHVPWGIGNQDDMASKVIHKIPEKIRCTYCRIGVSKKTQDGVFLEKGSWDGSDIFKPRGAPVEFMVSEKFKVIVEKYQLKNAWLILSSTYRHDSEFPGKWLMKNQQ